MKLEHPDNTAAQQPSNDGATPQATRRRLIQTGLAGAPVLLALTSVPALAADCKQPSGFSASGNLSQNGATACTTKLLGVTYWQGQANSITNTDPDFDLPFGSIFTASPAKTKTLRETLLSGSEIEQKIAAAWFSVKGGSSLFTADQAVAMWNDGVVGGHYVPNPSVPSIAWNAVQVEQYLDYVLA